jgi:D-psicose/D-tagatose/L-ribulose 3-epimerase
MGSPLAIGVCTWTFGDLPLEEIAGRLAAWDFDGVELMGPPPEQDLVGLDAAEARRILEDEGLAVFSLTPDEVDLAHPDRAIRAAAIDYYRRLVDFAAVFGDPIVSCHGYVGRVRAISSQTEERALLADSVAAVAVRAEELGLRLAMEVLNRYESHLLTTADEAMTFVRQVGAANVGLLLDAYHMNLEEADPADALRLVGDRLWLYHVADSNRQGVGRGHTDFRSQIEALAGIGYTGPAILECTAPGPDPFTAIKDESSLAWLETYLTESRQALQAMWRV